MCAVCHADIVKSYKQTAMAPNSVQVTGIKKKGGLYQNPSGTRYTIMSNGISER